MEVGSVTVTVTPSIDWGNVLAVIPTEQLERELERRERPAHTEALRNVKSPGD